MSRKRRSAFTLLELLLVVGVIGLLVALLLPAVQTAREGGRRLTCRSNLRQIGLALRGYESALNCFPPAVIWAPQGEPLGQVSWFSVNWNFRFAS
jgi:prepilin-type N-terminal cleavage/methylation domain-containing protein